MSGLAGLVDFDGREGRALLPELSAMVAAAAHRGPDGLRHHARGLAAFAHLALDAGPLGAAGAQPLASADGELLVVADARLDRRRELGRELASETGSDPELILAAYRRWGVSCPEHLAGDFAFALWDSGHRRLLCARDRLGIKPLHWARSGGLFCVGSEAGQILAHPRIPCRLDEATLADHLVGISGDPERSLFLDVHRLAPGHLLTATPEATRIERYWDVDPSRRTVYRTADDYAERFLELFESAVAERLESRGSTLAIALSGGLDSSAVAALARERLGAAGAPRLLACSMVFDDLADCDERDYAATLAASAALDVERVSAERFASFAPAAGSTLGREGMDLSWEPCLEEMLRRARRRGARVLLTGQGGDDLLGGSARTCLGRLLGGDLGAVAEVVRYARERREDVARVLYRAFVQPLLPVGLDRGLHRLAGRPLSPEVPAWIAPGFARRTGLRDRLRRDPAPRRFGERARQELYAGALGQYGGSEAIYWYDCLAARQGIEVRHPFLERGIVEYLLSIPSEQLFRVGQYKPLLKRALRGILPEEIRQRSGKARLDGFIDLVHRERGARQIRALLEKPVGVTLGIFDGPQLRAAYEAYRSGRHDDWKRLVVYAITAELWLKSHLERSTTRPATVQSAA